MLTNIPPEQHQSYEALTVALDTHFGLSHQTELKQMQLKARTRRRDESLEELAEDVEHLVHLAYPEAAEAMVEVLATAKDQFVDALPDEDMRLRIRQNKPATLRDALGTGRQQFPTTRKERNCPERSNLVCWECKERGHWKRDCPKLRSQPAETEVSQSGNKQ